MGRFTNCSWKKFPQSWALPQSRLDIHQWNESGKAEVEVIDRRINTRVNSQIANNIFMGVNCCGLIVWCVVWEGEDHFLDQWRCEGAWWCSSTTMKDEALDNYRYKESQKIWSLIKQTEPPTEGRPLWMAIKPQPSITCHITHVPLCCKWTFRHFCILYFLSLTKCKYRILDMCCWVMSYLCSHNTWHLHTSYSVFVPHTCGRWHVWWIKQRCSNPPPRCHGWRVKSRGAASSWQMSSASSVCHWLLLLLQLILHWDSICEGRGLTSCRWFTAWTNEFSYCISKILHSLCASFYCVVLWVSATWLPEFVFGLSGPP